MNGGYICKDLRLIRDERETRVGFEVLGITHCAHLKVLGRIDGALRFRMSPAHEFVDSNFRELRVFEDIGRVGGLTRHGYAANEKSRRTVSGAETVEDETALPVVKIQLECAEARVTASSRGTITIVAAMVN